MSQMVAVATPSNGFELAEGYRAARRRLLGLMPRPVEKLPTQAAETEAQSDAPSVNPPPLMETGSVDNADNPTSPDTAVQVPFIYRRRAIIRRIAEEFGVTVKDIIGRSQTRNIAFARHKAMYAMLVETKLSLTQIGRDFERDHTTIINGVRTYCRRNDVPLPRGMTPGDPAKARIRRREWARRRAAA